MKKLGLAIAAITMTVAASPASAATFLYSFTSAAFTGSGTFTTSDTANANGSFTITNTVGSGSLGGTAYTFSGPTTYAGADNQLFANRPAQYLSFDGTSFALSPTLSANIYFSTAAGAYRYLTTGGNVLALDSFTITRASGAVPEPATWLMMMLGFGMVGYGVRRRTARIAFAA